MYNISSGMPLKEQVDILLDICDNGKILADEFSEKRNFSKDIPSNEPLKRNKIPLFKFHRQ